MAESVMISLGVTSKNLDAELQKTKNKFDKLNQSVVSDNTNKNINKMKNALDGLGKMGDSLGGMFGKIAGGFSSLLSPVGLLTAGIGLAITASVNLYKKLTLSHEQYIAYLEHTMQRSKEKLGKIQNQEKTDSDYFERLKQLNQAEQMSNATKTQAITLIQLLTAKYGDLGLSIDETTDKIIGLDSAFAIFQKRISKIKLNQLKVQSEIAKKIASSQYEQISFTKHAGIDTKQKDYQTFLTPQERALWAAGNSHAVDKAKGRMEKWNLESDYDISDYRKKEFQRLIKLSEVYNEKFKTGNYLPSDVEQAKNLTIKIKNLQKIMQLETKLKVVEEMIELTASDPKQNQKWKDLSIHILESINKLQKYNIEVEKSQTGYIARLNKIKQLSNEQLQIRQKIQESNKNTQSNKQQVQNMKQQYKLDKLTKTERAKEYSRKADQAYSLKSASSYDVENSDVILNYKYGEKLDELEGKQKQGTITSTERKYLEIYRKLYGARIKAYRQAHKEFERLHKKRKTLTPEQTLQYQEAVIKQNVKVTGYDKLLEQQKVLHGKQQNGGLTASEFNKLLEINKQIAVIEQTIASSKELQSKYGKQAYEWELKQKQIQDELDKYFKDANNELLNELQYQQLILKNDIKQIEKKKIINQLAAQGHHMEKLMQNPEFAKKVDDYVEKKMDLDKQKYLNQENKSIDRQIELEKLKLKNKIQEIEKQKLLNELEDKKIKLDQKQIDAILAKRKQLQTVQFSNLIKDQTDGLLQSVQTQIDKKKAQTEKRIKEYENQYGKLNQNQKDAVKSIVDMEFEISKVQNEKIDFSHNEIQTNSLTQRGGFAGGVVMSRMETINEKINTNATKQVQLLTSINKLIQDLKNAGII